GLTQELQLQGHCTELPLQGLTEVDIAAYLAKRFPGSVLPPELVRVLHQRTEGNPLFLVNLVGYLITQGMLVQGKGGWHLTGEVEAVACSVPESLRQMIERHSAWLSPEDQRVLEVASVVGVEFSAAAVAAGVEVSAERVEEQCTVLARRQHFLARGGRHTWPDGTVTTRYRFQHALYRDVWYERVTEARRRDLDRRIGPCLEAGYGPQASTIAAELAVHFVQGRDYARAVPYLQQAADNAVHRHAYSETIALLTQGLDLLPHLPDTEARWRHEFSLHMRLSSVLMATKGYAAPEVEATLTRAVALSQQIGEVRYRLQVLLALAGFYLFRGDLQQARTCAEQCLDLGQQTHQRRALLWAHYLLGVILHAAGEF